MGRLPVVNLFRRHHRSVLAELIAEATEVAAEEATWRCEPGQVIEAESTVVNGNGRQHPAYSVVFTRQAQPGAKIIISSCVALLPSDHYGVVFHWQYLHDGHPGWCSGDIVADPADLEVFRYTDSAGQHAAAQADRLANGDQHLMEYFSALFDWDGLPW